MQSEVPTPIKKKRERTLKKVRRHRRTHHKRKKNSKATRVHPVREVVLQKMTKLVLAKWISPHCHDAKRRLATQLFGDTNVFHQTLLNNQEDRKIGDLNTNDSTANGPTAVNTGCPDLWHITVENAGSGIELGRFEISPHQSMGILKTLVKETCGEDVIPKSTTPTFLNTEIDFADDSAAIRHAGVRNEVTLALVRTPGWTGKLEPFLSNPPNDNPFNRLRVSESGEYFAVCTDKDCKVFKFRDGQPVMAFTTQRTTPRAEQDKITDIAFSQSDVESILIYICRQEPGPEQGVCRFCEVHSLTAATATSTSTGLCGTGAGTGPHKIASFSVDSTFDAMCATPEPDLVLFFSEQQHQVVLHNIFTGAQRSVKFENFHPSGQPQQDGADLDPNVDPNPTHETTEITSFVYARGEHLVLFCQEDSHHKPTMCTFNYLTGRCVHQKVVGQLRLPSLNEGQELSMQHAACSLDGKHAIVLCFRSYCDWARQGNRARLARTLGDACISSLPTPLQPNGKTNQQCQRWACRPTKSQPKLRSWRLGGPLLFGSLLAADLSPCGTLVAILTFEGFLEILQSPPSSSCCSGSGSDLFSLRCVARCDMNQDPDFSLNRRQPFIAFGSDTLKVDIRILRRSPHLATVVVSVNGLLLVRTITISNTSVRNSCTADCTTVCTRCQFSIKESFQRCASRLSSRLRNQPFACDRREAFEWDAQDLRCTKCCGPNWGKKVRQLVYAITFTILVAYGCWVIAAITMSILWDESNQNDQHTVTAFNTTMPAISNFHHRTMGGRFLTTAMHLRGTTAIPLSTEKVVVTEEQT